MSKFKWLARRGGRIVADGVVDAETDRRGIEQVLGSREWPGDGYSLKVGDASISFDAAEVGLLAGGLDVRHPRDDAPTRAVPKGALEAVGIHDETVLSREKFEEAIVDMVLDAAAQERAKNYVLGDRQSSYIRAWVQPSCCPHTTFEAFFSPVHPERPFACKCPGCGGDLLIHYAQTGLKVEYS